MFILGNRVECLGREVQGGAEHVQQGSCCSQGVGVREGFLKEVALAVTRRVHGSRLGEGTSSGWEDSTYRGSRSWTSLPGVKK